MFRKDEKLSVTVLKLFDSIIQKNIPSIAKHLYLDSTRKLV